MVVSESMAVEKPSTGNGASGLPWMYPYGSGCPRRSGNEELELSKDPFHGSPVELEGATKGLLEKSKSNETSLSIGGVAQVDEVQFDVSSP